MSATGRSAAKARGVAISVAEADLLVPRLTPPTIARTRLLDALDEGASTPVTMLSAPPGTGKTTLLASWATERPREQLAWLSVPPTGGAHVFWAEWVESLRRAAPPGSALGSLTPPRATASRNFVVALMNAFMDLEEPLTAVIDDFHHACGRGVMDAFDELLRTAPTPLRLVISTRHDPPLPLHLLRASGELSELRGKDLAFTAAEAADYLAALD